MSGCEELIQLIDDGGRRVYVAESLIDFTKTQAVKNTIFILQLPEGSTAAGGRGGGLGERRVVKTYHFRVEDGGCRKVGETEDAEKLERLDLPYHATALPIVMPDGSERLVSGVVDPEFVSSYVQVLGPG